METEVIAVIIAALGLGLGILNTVWIFIRDSARLHISCRHEPPDSKWAPEDHRLFVAVGNASYFSLTISGIYLSNWLGTKVQKVNFYLPTDFSNGGGHWSFLLAQGAEMTFNLSRSSLGAPELFMEPKISWWNSCLVIETATGERFYKRGRAIRTFLKSKLTA